MSQRSLFDQLESSSTSSQQDGHVRETAWLDGVLEWLTSEADSGVKSNAFLPSSVPAGFLAKTSPAFCPSTEEGIGLPSSGTWQNWGMGSPTAFLTLSGSEFPSVAVVSSLSDVLETGDVPQKFYLSPKAFRPAIGEALKPFAL